MPLSKEEWHDRFLLQAQWTEGLRAYFFDLIKDDSISSILDIGCGTGALLTDLGLLSPAQIVGADTNLGYLTLARSHCPDCGLANADAHLLPFAPASFDVVLCHYFLMWVGDPAHALVEMTRVVKPGGTVVAFAEPDYGGRIDYPPEFDSIRDLQLAGLQSAGADPRMGRRLQSLFQSGDFQAIQCGVYQGSWPSVRNTADLDSEWKMLAEDLSGSLAPRELAALQEQDLAARKKGTRLIYVPTFYAWGKTRK